MTLEECQIHCLLDCERHLEDALRCFHLARIETIDGNRMIESLQNAKQGIGGMLKREY